MRNFITVSLILDALKKEHGRGNAHAPAMTAQPTFREWRVGFIVAHKNDRSSTYKIHHISDGETTGYQSSVTLVATEDETENRMLRGPTLQSSYVFVGRGDVPMDAEEVKKTIKPMTMAIDTIRSIAPRSKNRPGSLVILKDGGKYPCAEDHDTIVGMVERASPPDLPAIMT